MDQSNARKSVDEIVEDESPEFPIHGKPIKGNTRLSYLNTHGVDNTIPNQMNPDRNHIVIEETITTVVTTTGGGKTESVKEIQAKLHENLSKNENHHADAEVGKDLKELQQNISMGRKDSITDLKKQLTDSQKFPTPRFEESFMVDPDSDQKRYKEVLTLQQKSDWLSKESDNNHNQLAPRKSAGNTGEQKSDRKIGAIGTHPHKRKKDMFPRQKPTEKTNVSIHNTGHRNTIAVHEGLDIEQTMDRSKSVRVIGTIGQLQQGKRASVANVMYLRESRGDEKNMKIDSKIRHENLTRDTLDKTHDNTTGRKTEIKSRNSLEVDPTLKQVDYGGAKQLELRSRFEKVDDLEGKLTELKTKMGQFDGLGTRVNELSNHLGKMTKLKEIQKEGGELYTKLPDGSMRRQSSLLQFSNN